MHLRRPVLAWLLILALAILNGGMRDAVLVPHLGKPPAFSISGLLLSAIVLAVATSLAHWLQLDSPRRCVAVGLLWLTLTLSFEFSFGGLVQHRSLEDMLAAYTFQDGNLWPIVLGVTFMAPFVAARLRHSLEGGRHDPT